MVSTNDRSPIFWPLRRVLGVRRLAHALLAARHDDIGVAGGDLLGAQGHGAQARAAQLVQAPGRALDRDAGVDRGLAGRALAGGGLQHLAQDHFVDVGGRDAGPLDGGLDGQLAQLVGRQAGQGAVERSDRRAGGGNDDDVAHSEIAPETCSGRFSQARRP
jgi:hypothetical protein